MLIDNVNEFQLDYQIILLKEPFPINILNLNNPQLYLIVLIISKKELYGGKICAALDRQHPRDLFDVKELIKKSEIDKELIKGFLVMLLSHDKPLHETLNPNIKNQNEIYSIN